MKLACRLGQSIVELMGSNRVLKIRGPFGSLVDLSNPVVRSPYRRQSEELVASFEKFKNALKSKIAVARQKKVYFVPEPNYVLGICENSQVVSVRVDD